MAFTVRGFNGCSDAQAEVYVENSLQYLRRSALAKSILDDLEEHADVCIDVDKTTDPFFAHPESSYDTITADGTAVWNPTMSVMTTDSKNYRPDEEWVPQHKERARIDVQKKGMALKLAKAFKLSETKKSWQMVNAHKTGSLSQHMCLIHELGHALQYANYPQKFLGIKAYKTPAGKLHSQTALEETNLYCVETPVALELNQLGATETPRWVYGHTDGIMTVGDT